MESDMADEDGYTGAWGNQILITNLPTNSVAAQTIASRFNAATDYANSIWTQTQAILASLGNIDFGIDIPELVLDDISYGGLEGITFGPPTAPDIGTIALSWPGFSGTPPSYYDITIPSVTVPGYNIPDPGLNIPDPPTVIWPVLDTNSPSINEIDIPSKPSVNIPPVPTLNFPSIPSPPEYSVPEFTATEPVADLTPPEPAFSWSEAKYTSELLTILTQKLYDQVISGGSGLGAAVEAAIYARAVARQELEIQTMYDNALDYFASRGCPLPPGALAGVMLEADYKINQLRTDINNDILVQESKLAQENTHFVIQKALELEKAGMDYSNQMQNRAFEAAKVTVEIVLKVFELKVETYKAKVVIYQALAEVYKTRILAETAKAEFYKAQIEGVKAHVEIQRSMVELYEAQLKGVAILYEAYKTEMEAANIRANIERIKIEAYKAVVEAYAVKVQAATARYEGYKAQIQGEALKVEIYKARTEAYETQVKAIAIAAEVDLNRAKIALAKTEAQVEIYKAEIQKYATDVTAKTAEIDAQVKIAGLDVDIYKADISKYAAEIDAMTKIVMAQVEEMKAKVQLEIGYIEVQMRKLVAQMQTQAELAKAAAMAGSQIAAASISTFSASSHLGFTESRSDAGSWNTNRSQSTSRQDSYSIIHQYIHEDD